MGSHSYTTACRNCGEEADALQDSDGTAEWCPHCGYTCLPTISQCPLDELNERRLDRDDGLAPLTELPPWNL